MSLKSNIIKIYICLTGVALCFTTPVWAVKSVPSEVRLNEQKQTVLVSKISFEDVLKKAKEHSYDLQIADYNVLISKQEVRGARSEYFPRLNLSGGMEYTKNYRDVRETTVMSIGDAFINPYTRYQSVLGINVAYNLFDFGVRGGNLKIAKEDVALKKLQTKETLQELNLTLLDSYTKILITSKQIEINKEILALEEKNLAIKERLFKAREISKTEINDERVKVKSIKQKISELNSIKAESLNWLSFYTGEEYDINNLQVAELKRSNCDVNAFRDYTKSITWKIHEKNIKKKELELKVAKRNNYPKLNAYGRYYMYGSDHSSYSQSLGIEPSNFTVGASLNMPLFDGFRNNANIKKIALELKQLNVERDKAIAQLMARLASMRSNLIYLDEQVSENSQMIEELTDKENSLSKLASKKLVSPIEYNDSKIELLNQQIEYDKNSITQNALTRGIEILTEEQ